MSRMNQEITPFSVQASHSSAFRTAGRENGPGKRSGFSDPAGRTLARPAHGRPGAETGKPGLDPAEVR